MLRTYCYMTTLRCHLSNGTTNTLQRFTVEVQAHSEEQADSGVRSVATEKVHDLGCRVLDAPMDRLEVLSSRLVSWQPKAA